MHLAVLLPRRLVCETAFFRAHSTPISTARRRHRVANRLPRWWNRLFSLNKQLWTLSLRHKFRSARCNAGTQRVPVYLARIACGRRSGCIRSVARTAELVGGLPIIDLCYCVGRGVTPLALTRFSWSFSSFSAAPSSVSLSQKARPEWNLLENMISLVILFRSRTVGAVLSTSTLLSN